MHACPPPSSTLKGLFCAKGGGGFQQAAPREQPAETLSREGHPDGLQLPLRPLPAPSPRKPPVGKPGMTEHARHPFCPAAAQRSLPDARTCAASYLEGQETFKEKHGPARPWLGSCCQGRCCRPLSFCHPLRCPGMNHLLAQTLLQVPAMKIGRCLAGLHPGRIQA